MNKEMMDAYDGLVGRTYKNFKRAHVIEQADGIRFNLDLNVSADSDAALITAMAAVGATLTPESILPAAPVELWERFIAIDPDAKRLLVIDGLPGMQKRLSIVVRMEARNG